MWYECLPPLMLIGTFMSSYQFFSVIITNALMGKPNMKNMDECFERVLYTRDLRVSGNPYVLAGLENIPDD